MRFFGNTRELNYLTHIVCRLFERQDVPADSDKKVCFMCCVPRVFFTAALLSCTPVILI